MFLLAPLVNYSTICSRPKQCFITCWWISQKGSGLGPSTEIHPKKLRWNPQNWRFGTPGSSKCVKNCAVSPEQNIQKSKHFICHWMIQVWISFSKGWCSASFIFIQSHPINHPFFFPEAHPSVWQESQQWNNSCGLFFQRCRVKVIGAHPTLFHMKGCK